MRRHYFVLPVAVAGVAAALTVGGAVIKYDTLAPLGLADGTEAAGLPFRMLTDLDLKAQVDILRAAQQGGAEPADTQEPDDGDEQTPEPPDKGSEDDGSSAPADEPSTPIEPDPTAPEPTEPDPTAPDPSTPEPTEPDPTVPDQTDPEPADTKPAEPTPTEPAPTEPAPKTDTPPSDAPADMQPPVAVEDGTIVTGTGGEFTPGAMVDDSWFDDALFIGDSRTDGLRLYCRAGKADYFAVTGLSVFSALSKRASDKTFSNLTLNELLDSRNYGKIFVCLGLNECGSNPQTIVNAYVSLLNTVKAKQPKALIIVQGVMACGRKKAAKSSAFGPKNINRLNANLKAMAESCNVKYIDPNTLFADSEGYLPDKFSGDGCHFYAKYYDLWMSWIKCQVYGLAAPSAVPPEPSAPPEPEEPTEPTQPAEPTQTTEPVNPTEPENPTEPAEPTVQTEPPEQTEQTQPTEQTDPTQPTQPTEPDEPPEETNL